MNYDLPSGNHEKALLFYIHYSIILSMLYLIVLFQASQFVLIKMKWNLESDQVLKNKLAFTYWFVIISIFFKKVKIVSVIFDKKSRMKLTEPYMLHPFFSTVTHKPKNLVNLDDNLTGKWLHLSCTIKESKGTDKIMSGHKPTTNLCVCIYTYMHIFFTCI